MSSARAAREFDCDLRRMPCVCGAGDGREDLQRRRDWIAFVDPAGDRDRERPIEGARGLGDLGVEAPLRHLSRIESDHQKIIAVRRLVREDVVALSAML